MKPPTPFLWFNSNAEEAANFYVSVFKNSKMGAVSRYPHDTPGAKKGDVMVVKFCISGQEFTALNGGPAFKFNEAVSFVVECDNQAEIDEYWKKLTADGGKPGVCGWLKDKFGLSWQIVPAHLGKLLTGKNGAQTAAALMKMTRLNIAELETAAG